MAASPLTLYRNYTANDNYYPTNFNYQCGDNLPSINNIGILPPNGKRFKEWNWARDGSSTSYNVGEQSDSEHESYYIIWENLPTNYKVLEEDLIAVADAINAIDGKIGKLTWPDDFLNGIAKINFTISTNNYNCIADRGMTWQEWVNSAYNTYGIYISGTNVYLPEYPYNSLYITSRYTQVNSTDLILANFDYMREPGPV